MRLSCDYVAPGETVFIDDAGVLYHRTFDAERSTHHTQYYGLKRIPEDSTIVPRNSAPIQAEEETLP